MWSIALKKKKKNSLSPSSNFLLHGTFQLWIQRRKKKFKKMSSTFFFFWQETISIGILLMEFHCNKFIWNQIIQARRKSSGNLISLMVVKKFPPGEFVLSRKGVICFSEACDIKHLWSDRKRKDGWERLERWRRHGWKESR